MQDILIFSLILLMLVIAFASEIKVERPNMPPIHRWWLSVKLTVLFAVGASVIVAVLKFIGESFA